MSWTTKALPHKPRDISLLPQPPNTSIKATTTNEERKHSMPLPTAERNNRTSFSSIKESNCGGPQSFTDSKTSSYIVEAIDDSDSRSPTPEQRAPGMLNPHSTLHGLCPCDSFNGWKSITVGGKMASRSFGDLNKLRMRRDWHSTVKKGDRMDLGGVVERKADVRDERYGYPAGRSPFERLPMELLGSIIDLLAVDIPPNGFTARNIDLMSLLLTSRGIHSATLATLYGQITIPHSRIFRKFLSQISEDESLGTIVRRLDFSHYNPTGGGQTARERMQTQNLIPATLLQCLDLTPNLREFLAQEHIDDELDYKVMTKLLCDLPQLKALDLCACSSSKFRDAFTTAIASPSLPTSLPITRLGLHENAILPSTVFDTLLPRLPHLKILDLSHTRVTDQALKSIPTAARLTHLNLSKCSSLSGSVVVEFLRSHPAAQTLVYLNLGMDVKSAEMLSAEDITNLIPILPSTLRSLSLKGSKMLPSHIPLLLPLTKHLEELGLGRHLELRDIIRLILPGQNAFIEDQLAWIPHSLRYIDVSDLSVSQLDLCTLFGSSCLVLKSVASPLEVLDLSAEVYKKLEKSSVVKRAGWDLKDLGRRYWLVRQPGPDGVTDTGERSWKMGACYWGMRKIPVSRQEVGGMYGHYMFKR